jgi:hypothetical protein
MSAPWTRIDMAAQCHSTAPGDGSKHTQLLVAEPGSILFQEAVALCVKDVGHLHGRTVHSGLRSRRDRATSVAGLVPTRSRRVETACRWLLER